MLDSHSIRHLTKTRKARPAPETTFFEPLEPRVLLAADLTGSLEFTDAVAPGDRIIVNLTLENSGDMTASGTIMVDLYGHAKGTTFNLDTAIFLGTTRLSGTLDPFEVADEIELRGTVPPNTTPGPYGFAAIIDATDRISESDETNNTALSIQSSIIRQLDFDLTLELDSRTDVPSAIVLGTDVGGRVRVDVVNTASSTSVPPKKASVDVSVFARPVGAVNDSQDVLLNDREVSVSVNNLKPDKSKAASVNITFPDSLGAGDYQIVVKLDGDNDFQETNDNNNELILAQTVNVAPPFKDLTVALGSRLDLPEMAIAGQKTKIKIPIEITNEGNIKLDSGKKILVTVHARPMSGGADTLLQIGGKDAKEVSVSSLKDGKTKKVTLSNILLPESLPEDMYQLVVAVDTGNAVAESDENNNDVITPADPKIDVKGPFKDLTVALGSRLDLPEMAIAGQKTKIKIPIEITNEGNIKLDSGKKILVTVHARPMSGGTDTLLQIGGKDSKQVSVSNLKDGKTKKVTLSNITLPADLPADMYQLVVAVDTGNVVAESDEDNNDVVTTADPKINVKGPFKDLTVALGSRLDLPAMAIAGQKTKIKIPIEITNEGNIKLDSGKKILVTVHARPMSGGADRLLQIGGKDSKQVSVSNLKDGKTKKVTLSNITLPADLPADMYQLVVAVDTGNVVAESDEDNNDVVTTADPKINVKGPFKDLTVVIGSKVNLPTSAIAGQKTKIKIPIEITNEGNIKLDSGKKILVTVHARPMSGGADRLLQIGGKDSKQVSVSNLKDGKTKKVTLSNITLPADLPADMYQLVVAVDTGNVVAESDEDNNDVVTTADPKINVKGPFKDLTVVIGSKVNLPTSAIAGQKTKIKIPIEITNEGNIKLDSGKKILVTVHARPMGGGADRLLQIGGKDAKEVSVSNLKDGKTKKVTLSNILLPESLPEDMYQLVVAVDTGNAVAESDENNNDVITPADPKITVAAPVRGSGRWRSVQK